MDARTDGRFKKPRTSLLIRYKVHCSGTVVARIGTVFVRVLEIMKKSVLSEIRRFFVIRPQSENGSPTERRSTDSKSDGRFE